MFNITKNYMMVQSIIYALYVDDKGTGIDSYVNNRAHAVHSTCTTCPFALGYMVLNNT
jgi:hypothetical protein